MFNDADYNRRLYLEGLGFVRYEPVSSTTEADGTVVRKLSMEPRTGRCISDLRLTQRPTR